MTKTPANDNRKPRPGWLLAQAIKEPATGKRF